MATENTKPWRAALSGALLLLPFAALNAIVANRIEPFFGAIRPGQHTSRQEYVLFAIVLLCIPLGAMLAARPMLRKDAHGERRFYASNALVAAALLGVFVTITVAVGTEIYYCSVLDLPNCD